jgi:hypothetical protein
MPRLSHACRFDYPNNMWWYSPVYMLPYRRRLKSSSIILPVVLYGRGSWSVTLTEQQLRERDLGLLERWVWVALPSGIWRRVVW